MNERQPKRSPKQGADWLAWSLHLVLGLFVGSVVGVIAGLRMMRMELIARDQFPIVIISVSLFGGAITSSLGDRAWFSSTLFSPDPPPQSPASRASSRIIGGCGVLLFLFAVFSHLSGGSGSVPWSSFPGIDVFLLLIDGFVAYWVVYALRTGTAYTLYQGIERHKSPLEFWLYVTFGALSVVGILVKLLR